LDKGVLKIIRSGYGLPYLLEGANLGGLSTLNLIIKANGDEFVLKQYQEKNINKIEKLEKITFFLKKNNLPVVVPKKTLKGNYHLEVGNLFFVLYPKVNGHILYENSLTEKSLINTAKLLQRFHGLDEPCPLAAKKNILSLNKFLKNAQECKKLIFNNTLGAEIDDLSLHFVDKKTTLIKKAFRKKIFQEERYRNDLVHGDFHNENILFNANDEIACLLDFEEVHYGCGVKDLMQFIQLACCNTGYKEENLKKARIFLQAYLLKRFIKKETLIFYANRYMYHMASSFFFEKNLYLTKNIKFIDYIKRDLLKLSYLEQHADTFIDKLLS
jgi:Ser/Thr protein kinase RdoA (MazF antagonist)